MSLDLALVTRWDRISQIARLRRMIGRSERQNPHLIRPGFISFLLGQTCRGPGYLEGILARKNSSQKQYVFRHFLFFLFRGEIGIGAVRYGHMYVYGIGVGKKLKGKEEGKKQK